MKSKTILYKLCYPNGAIGNLRVPKAWAPFEVAERFRSSIVFMWVPKGYSVWGRALPNLKTTLAGRMWVLIANRELWYVPGAPIDEHDACQMLDHYGSAKDGVA